MVTINIQRVIDALATKGYSEPILELPDSTRTSKEAANALGCNLNQIAKSIVFKGKKSEEIILVIACGSNRINEKKVSALLGEPIKKASADFIKEKTGFIIGGVPPIGYNIQLKIYLDEELLNLKEIWASAGGSFSIFKLTPPFLKEITNAEFVDIKE